MTRFFHYTRSPFTLDASRRYTQKDHFKPAGLWLSAEDGTSEQHGWKDWCESEEFNLESLAHRTEVFIALDANVLWIETVAELDAFSEQFLKPEHRYLLNEIDWSVVAQRYAGIIIAPYQWSRRLDRNAFWYYCWDCASACIWDLSAVSTECEVSREVYRR